MHRGFVLSFLTQMLQVTKMTRPTTSEMAPDTVWQKFVREGLVEKSLKQNDFIGPDNSLPEYSDQYPRHALKTLKSVLTPDAHRKLSGRWRKYKYSVKHNNTTLTIRQETLQRLKAVARKANLQDENYDLILEYLLDPEDELEPAKQHVAELDLPSSLDVDDMSVLLRAKLRLRGATWKSILSTIDYAFSAGWFA